MIVDHRLDKRLIVTYLTTVLIFILLAWRSEINNSSIQANAARINASAWKNCHDGAVRAASINDTYAQLAAQLTALPESDQAAKLEALIYGKAALAVPDCGPKP